MGRKILTAEAAAADEIEFIRNAFVLIPRAGEAGFETVLVAPDGTNTTPRLFCSCTAGDYARCGHAQRLTAAWKAFTGRRTPAAPHPASAAARCLQPLIKSHPWLVDGCAVRRDGRTTVRIVRDGAPVIEYVSEGGDAGRFAGRFEMTAGERCVTRADFIRRAEKFVLSEAEQAFAMFGRWTCRRTEENSVWYRLLYHLRREYDESAITISPVFDEEAGALWLCGSLPGRRSWFFRWRVPGDAARASLERLEKTTSREGGSLLCSQEADIRFLVSFGARDRRVTFTPYIFSGDTPHESGERVEVEPRRIVGDLFYLPPRRALRRLSEASLRILAAHWTSPHSVPVEEAGGFIEKNLGFFSVAALDGSDGCPDLFSSAADDLARLDGARIVRSFDAVELTPTAVDGAFCELAAAYVSGSAAVPLADLLEARQRGRRFLFSGGVIVDLKHIPLTRMYRTAQKAGAAQGLRLPRAALVQITAAGTTRLKIDTNKAWAGGLMKMLEFKPAEPLRPIRGLKSVLRSYQLNGVSWLLFLYDNGFGGLLCDDMGLGKTHQALGFMCALREQRGLRAPMLVVCPLTVIGHWLRLAETFAPGLCPRVIQGIDRDWTTAAKADLVITSYGVLRSDIDEIASIRFGLAVFDEAQNIKNPAAQVSAAGRAVNAGMKLCLTGTPIENAVHDLKSLFDLVMPQYLGADEDFLADFAAPIEDQGDKKARENLQKITAPFILRRLKKAVLADLPPKIEDIRLCELADAQALLYDEIAGQRGGPLLAELRNTDRPIPYMHIFAVLMALKQCCDHPAVVARAPADYEKYQSGKWDLFTELLDEALGSEQKVVVYSQFLDMIEIIRLHCEKAGVMPAVLTGKSGDRGAIVRRFNEDAGCRVFIGSLKAGGAGIDLTAASTVIHYDRWWNAAREDQATDRVHRIGQTRGVQVLKLVTRGSVEERIDALIAKRRELAETLLAEDAPEEMKSFTREELIELLKGRNAAVG